MLTIYHAFCERLHVDDFNMGSMHSREVVQTFNITSLSDRAVYTCMVWDLGNPAKIQGKTQKCHVLAPPNAKRHA